MKDRHFSEVMTAVFRLTFDKNIITRREDVGLENGIFGSKLIDDGTYIMEVKYIEGMPLWFVKILRENDLQKTSFFKIWYRV